MTRIKLRKTIDNFGKDSQKMNRATSHSRCHNWQADLPFKRQKRYLVTEVGFEPTPEDCGLNTAP